MSQEEPASEPGIAAQKLWRPHGRGKVTTRRSCPGKHRAHPLLIGRYQVVDRRRRCVATGPLRAPRCPPPQRATEPHDVDHPPEACGQGMSPTPVRSAKRFDLVSGQAVEHALESRPLLSARGVAVCGPRASRFDTVLRRHRVLRQIGPFGAEQDIRRRSEEWRPPVLAA